MSKHLFPDAPEDLSALGTEELADLLASFKDVSAKLKAGDIDLVEAFGEDMSEAERGEEVMRQWRAAAETAQRIKAELKASEDAVEAFAEEAEALDSAFAEEEEEAEVTAEADAEELAAEKDEASEEDDGGEDEEPEKTAAAVEPEPVVAAAQPQRAVRYPAVRRENRAAPDRASRSALVASSEVRGLRPGQEITDSRSLAVAMIETARARGPVVKSKNGGEERVLIASARMEWPEDRTLRARDPEGNSEKIRAIGSPYFGLESREALVASGGICAPPTPFYDIPSVATRARPIRDSLPGFIAERGAVSVPSVDTIGSVTTGVGVIEEADDALGGTFATKSCQAYDCPTWTDYAVGAIYHCRSFGNMNARTFPEGVANANENTMAAHARTAEGRLLDRMDAASLALTRAAVYGASRTLLYALQVSRAGIISRLRMDPATRFNVYLPFWGAFMFSSDLVNAGEEGNLDVAPEAVGGLLSRFGFNVTWHLDEGLDPAADTEIWPDEVDATTQDDWPGSTMIARLHPAGHFLYLDGGSLELGLVRDSTLNETNDHQIFGETFEQLAVIGPTQAAHRLEITICPDGTAAPHDVAAFTCSGS